MAHCLDSSIVEGAQSLAKQQSHPVSFAWNVPTTESLPEYPRGLDIEEACEDDRSSDGGDCLTDLIQETCFANGLHGTHQLHGNELTFRLDANGLIKEWNDKAVELTSFEKEDVIGRCFQEFVSLFIAFEYQNSFRDVLQKALEGQETTEFVLPLHALNAHCLQVLLTTVTCRNELGDISGALCIGKPLNEFRDIFHGSDIIFGIDATGCIIEWDANAVDITRFQIEDVIGRDVEDFVSMFITVESQSSVQEVLRKALMGKETSEFAFPFFTLDARCLHLMLTTVTRRNECGEIVGAECIGKFVGKEVTDSSSSQLRSLGKGEEEEDFTDTTTD